MKHEGQGETRHHVDDKGNVFSEGTPSSVDEQASFDTKEPSIGREGGKLLVVGSLILRHVDRWVVLQTHIPTTW